MTRAIWRMSGIQFNAWLNTLARRCPYGGRKAKSAKRRLRKLGYDWAEILRHNYQWRTKAGPRAGAKGNRRL